MSVWKVLAWPLDHFPFLACLAVGFYAGLQHHPELALEFFILGSLSEIAATVTTIRRDVSALRERADAEANR